MDEQSQEGSRADMITQLTEIEEVASMSQQNNLGNTAAKPSNASLSTLHNAQNAAMWFPHHYQNQIHHHQTINHPKGNPTFFQSVTSGDSVETPDQTMQPKHHFTKRAQAFDQNHRQDNNTAFMQQIHSQGQNLNHMGPSNEESQFNNNMSQHHIASQNYSNQMQPQAQHENQFGYQSLQHLNFNNNSNGDLPQQPARMMLRGGMGQNQENHLPQNNQAQSQRSVSYNDNYNRNQTLQAPPGYYNYSGQYNVMDQQQHQRDLSARLPDMHQSISNDFDDADDQGVLQQPLDRFENSEPPFLEQINLLSKDEALRFTQSQINEPTKFIDKLEKRVAVLEQLDRSKKTKDSVKSKQFAKQKELQMRVRRQNTVHQKQLSQLRNQMEIENRIKAQSLRFTTKQSLQQSKLNHQRKQKMKIDKLNQQYFNPKPEFAGVESHRDANASLGASSFGQNSDRLNCSLYGGSNTSQPANNRSAVYSSVGHQRKKFDVTGGTQISNRNGSSLLKQRFPSRQRDITQMQPLPLRRDLSSNPTNPIADSSLLNSSRRKSSTYSRVSVTRNIQERKDKKTLVRIQDTLQKLDHIQTLKSMENQLLVKVYGHQDAHRHKYKGLNDAQYSSLHQIKRPGTELDSYHQRGFSQQPLSLDYSQSFGGQQDESQMIQLNNILVPSSFQQSSRMTNQEMSTLNKNSSVQIARQTAQYAQDMSDKISRNVQDPETLEDDKAFANYREKNNIGSMATHEFNEQLPFRSQTAASSFFDHSVAANSTTHPMSRDIPRRANNHSSQNTHNLRKLKKNQANEQNATTPEDIEKDDDLQQNVNSQVPTPAIGLIPTQQQQHMRVGTADSTSTYSFNTALGTVNGYQQNNNNQQQHNSDSRIGIMHRNQVLEQLIGGDQGNNAFYHKIIMDELSLQNQQLQKEFEFINKRKKLKKNIKMQTPYTSSQQMAMENAGANFSETTNMQMAHHQNQQMVKVQEDFSQAAGVNSINQQSENLQKINNNSKATIHLSNGKGSNQNSSQHLLTWQNSSLYEEEKKGGGSASKSGLLQKMQKKQFQGEDCDTQHVIKIYDRSNKHFYKQKVNNAPDSGKNGSVTKSNTIEEDEDQSRHVMHAVRQGDNQDYGQGGKLWNAQGNESSINKFLGLRKKGVRKGKKNSKLVKPLSKMKIVVKSTKTISFDENSDDDEESSDHNDESDEHEQVQDGEQVNQDGNDKDTSFIKITNEGQKDKQSGHHSKADASNQVNSRGKSTTANMSQTSSAQTQAPLTEQQVTRNALQSYTDQNQTNNSSSTSNSATTASQQVQSSQSARFGGSRYQRKNRQTKGQKGNQRFGLGSGGSHSPLHEAKSEDEDEDENGKLGGVIQFHQSTTAKQDMCLFQGGGNDDLLPMIMMNGDQLFNNKADVPETQHEVALCSDPDGYNKDDSIPPVNEDDGGVFHYEQDHESLEDEVFELHTANKNDADNENGAAEIFDQQEEEEEEDLIAEDIDIDIEEPGDLYGDFKSQPQKKQSNSQSMLESSSGVPKEMMIKGQLGISDGIDNEQSNVTPLQQFENGLDGVAVEAKCATSNESSSNSRCNKDLLGLMNEELEHETELLYEEE